MGEGWWRNWLVCWGRVRGWGGEGVLRVGEVEGEVEMVFEKE